MTNTIREASETTSKIVPTSSEILLLTAPNPQDQIVKMDMEFIVFCLKAKLWKITNIVTSYIKRR